MRRRTCLVPPLQASDLMAADEAPDDLANYTAHFAGSKVTTKVTAGAGVSDAFKLGHTGSGALDEAEGRRLTELLEASMRKQRAASKSVLQPRRHSAAELSPRQQERRGEIIMGQDDSFDVGTPSDERMLVGSADLQSIVRAAEMENSHTRMHFDSAGSLGEYEHRILVTHKRIVFQSSDDVTMVRDTGIQPSTDKSSEEQPDMLLPVRGGSNFEPQCQSQKLPSVPLRFD